MDYFAEIVKIDPVNHYLVFTTDRLKELKANISLANINLLVSKLNYLLAKPYHKVTDKASSLCFGLNKHNYISLATYYWPNPATKNNLPYILRDGYPNPEGDIYDKNRLRDTSFTLYYDLLLYYLTNDKKYYYDMKRRLTVFFLNEETKMLPNMNHSQLIRGVNLGRGIGIIDFSANMSYVLILIKSLLELGYVEDNFYKDFKNWLLKFLNWLKRSSIALEEQKAPNNHGAMYDFLLLAINYYLGKGKDAKELYYSVVARIKAQIAADGSLPLELKRTKSKSYSLMGLKAFTDSALILNYFGYNLYDRQLYNNEENEDSLTLAIKYLLEHLLIADNWSNAQVASFDEATKLPVFLEAVEHKLINKLAVTIEKPIDDLLPIIVKSLVNI